MHRLVIPALLLMSNLLFASNEPDIHQIRANYSNDTIGVFDCKEKGLDFFKKKELDSAYMYYLAADHLMDEVEETSVDLRLSIWRGLGVIEAKRGNVDPSLEWLDKGLNYIKAHTLSPKNTVDFLINKGVTHYYAGDLAKALVPYLEATDICRAEGYDEKRALLLNNLGIFYRMLDRHSDALELYKESYDLRQHLNDTMGMANILFNMAAAYSQINDPRKALKSAKEARNLYSLLGSESNVLLSMLSEGTALLDLEEYERALPMLEDLYKNEKLPFEPKHKLLLHLSLAELYLHFDRLNEAYAQLRFVEPVVTDSDLIVEKVEYYQHKARLHKKRQEYKAAFENLELFVDAAETNNDRQNQQMRKEMETKYLSKEKDHEIAILESQNELSDIKLRSARQRNLGLGAGLVVFAILALILFSLFRKIKAKNQIISKANREKEILLKEIHHRVKNNLQVISALLNLQSRYVKDENAVEALRLGHDRVESMALIHKDLYQQDNLKGVNTQVYLEKLIDNLISSYNIDSHKITLDMDIDPLWLDVDTMIPLGLTINELLSNTLKHAFHEQETGHLTISLRENEDGLKLLVKDNGSGVNNVELLGKESFGYSLVQSFAKKLKADLRYENVDGFGVHMLIKDYRKTA